MADSEFDWTFDEIPVENPAESGHAERPAAPQQRRPPPPARPPAAPIAIRTASNLKTRGRWRLAALVLAPLVVAGLAVYLVYAVGWQRVRGQLTREVRYEDEQSLAGNVNAVMALHAFGNDTWQRRRTAEVAAGLAAPLPAASLLPVGETPEVTRVDAFGDRLYTSTVVREYTDSAGQVFRFRYTQRYFNNGPGLWQRLPPDEARLAATEIWSGRRISVTFPVADADWMTAALPQIDAYLVQACADWACPSELTLPVVFSGRLDDMARAVPVERTLTYTGGYPIIFDTTFRAPRYPRRVTFTSPQLAGVPHDEAASQALIRALTSDLLGQLAAETAGGNRAQSFYFLDALVARAEVRLGLSAVPPPQPTLAEYLPVGELWRNSVGTGGNMRPAVGPRLEAVWFLDEVLGDRLPTVDAALLATVNNATSLTDWLATGAQVDGEAAIAGWEAAVTGQLAAAAPGDWQQLDGLAYTCGGSAWLVGAHGPQPLPQEAGQAWLGPLWVSPDGSQIAAPAVMSDTGQLRLVHLSSMTATVVVEHAAFPVGWAATGELVVVDQAVSEGRMVNRLRVYNAATGAFAPVTGMELVTRSAQPVTWSANRQTLAVTLTDGVSAADARTLPAIIAFDNPFSLMMAAWQGHSPALSPDGRWLVYITTQATDARTAAPAQARIEIMDLETNTTHTILALADLAADQALDQLTTLRWSPDGSRLALVASLGNSDVLYLLQLDTAAAGVVVSRQMLPVPFNDFELGGFSPDSQYLTVADNFVGNAASTTRLSVLDLSSPGATVFEANGSWAAWAPTGHLLAIANAAGLYVADPITGEAQWITGGDCVPSWHTLP